jgi:hypothetical protein
VAATVEDDVRLLAAFASYLRRQLETVDDELLLQRLSGVGLENNPRPEEAARPPAS